MPCKPESTTGGEAATKIATEAQRHRECKFQNAKIQITNKLEIQNPNYQMPVWNLEI